MEARARPLDRGAGQSRRAVRSRPGLRPACGGLTGSRVASILIAVVWSTLASGTVPAEVGGEGAPVNLLFIHHSCGGQLLADRGPVRGGERDSGERCLYQSHPNGGGLRERLTAAGYRVHEASYGSQIGEDTDYCHWRAKFATQMSRILRTERQDRLLPEGEANAIVCFKSCFPNNGFSACGQEPGDPDGCARTLTNAKAAYRALLPLFREQPSVLFVAFTAPPLVEPRPSGPAATVKRWFQGRDRSGGLAREFSAWLTDRAHGWLAGYELPNVVVFDYYDVLTGRGSSDYAVFPTHDGRDSHPSSEGNERAATAFLPFLAAAVAAMDRPRP